jgi:hypothetical protein
MQIPLAIKTFIDDVTNLTPGACKLEHNGVYKRDMVRQKQKAAGRQFLLRRYADPINGATKK